MLRNKKNNHENSLKVAIIIIACAVIIIVLAASLSAVKIQRQMQMEKEVASPYYQAVFLNNGQVYFGKLSGINDQFSVLTEVYYLQANRNLQAPKEDGEVSPPQPDLSLIKLGNELHAPQDKISINRDNILFVVDLKDEGQVAQTIKSYKK